MLASVTGYGHNTNVLEFKTEPAIGAMASPNLEKCLIEVTQTDRRPKCELFDKV